MPDGTSQITDAATRRLRMLMLPSVRWRPNWDAFTPGAYPDPVLMYRLLARDHAIDTTLIDPFGLPWNPLAGRHQVLAGLDPARALAILTRHRRADLVLACFEPGVAALLALRRLARFRAPVAVVDIGLTETWRLRERLLDFVVPRADAIYPLGRNQVDYIHRRWATQADVRFIPQHVDAEFYQPSAAPTDGPVLSVGDDGGRDFDTLLAAFADLDATLLLKSSRVPPGASPPNVQVVPGRLDAHAYRALFQQAPLVVVPLRPMVTASGIGTVLEAMAMGKALVVSDSPGIRDYVAHEQTALMVSCGDAAAMRAAIQRLLHEPETRRRLGVAARAFVERNCTYAAHVAKLAAALRGLVPS
jgi:glycosyltransferase involved in cell wall biosynthesis